MSPKKIVALIFIFAGLGTLASFATVSYLRARKPAAGLKIETTPPSTVFVDNVQVGLTPFEKTFPPGEVTVKLIPDSLASSLTSYQTKVRLTNQVYTVIRREFAPTENQSAGEIITLQPLSDKSTQLSVVSSAPSSASVTLDGQPQGLTPLTVDSLTEGDHQLVVSSPGFTTRSFTAKAVAGYKLIVNVKLAGLADDQMLITPTPPAATPSAIPTGKLSPTPKARITATPASAMAKPYVTVSATPVGFLRVRATPSTSAQEIGQIQPGQSFPLLGSQLGWYQIKISLPATSSGWISSQYAQKYE